MVGPSQTTTSSQLSSKTMPDAVMEKAGVNMLPTPKTTPLAPQEADRKRSSTYPNLWSMDDDDNDNVPSLSSNSGSSATTSDFTDISDCDRLNVMVASDPFSLLPFNLDGHLGMDTMGIQPLFDNKEDQNEGTPLWMYLNFSELDDEITQPTVRQHVMQDFSRRQRKADSNQDRSAEIAKYDTSSTTLVTAPLPRLDPKTMTTCGPPQPHCSSGHDLVSTSPNAAMSLVVDASQKHERSVSPSNSDQSRSISDTGSRTSSGRPMDDLGDLDHHFLDMESSRLRSWLLIQFKSEPFLQHLQRQVMYQHDSSTPQDQSTDSSSQSTTKSSSSSPSTSSSIPTTLSGGASSGSKRRRDDSGEKDEEPKNKRRVPSDKGLPTPDLRLACFYNKHDPMMYRSNAQTGKRFEICETHSFENMNRLYEHLRRVHSNQPLQCPRCTRTDFRNTAELQAHQTAPEPCNLVPLTAVRRIKWLSDGERVALQEAVKQESKGLRRLADCTEKDRWGFAYRWLFPLTTLDDTPCPYMRDPVISIMSFIVDGFETRLRQLIGQSDDLEDFAGRFPAILEQFLAQYGIPNYGSEQLPPPLPDAITIPGDTRPGRPITLPPRVADEPRQSHSESQQHIHQAVLPPENRAYSSIALPEHSSAAHIAQATSPWPQPHRAASSHQVIGAWYSHADASYPDTSTNTGLLMSPTQWQYQPSTGIPAQEHRVFSPVDPITRATQPHYQRIQADTAFQYHLEHPIRDFPQHLGPANNMMDDSLTYDLLNMGTWAD